MNTYTIKSIKQVETYTGTLAKAIERAKAIDAEQQPAFGTQIELNENTVWDSEEETAND